VDDDALMALRANVLFTSDARGRMVSTNEPFAPSRRPAPTLWVGWTATRYHVRIGAAVSSADARELEAIFAAAPPPGYGLDWEVCRDVANTIGGAPQGGPAYRFGDDLAVGEGVAVTPDNVALARETYPWLVDELAGWSPCVAIVRDDAIVSVCFTARLDDHAAEAGVDTLPAYRGRGFAATATAAWAAAIRATGRVPFYSTSSNNMSSLAVTRRLGLVRFGEDGAW
jgi:hypothetical protein